MGGGVVVGGGWVQPHGGKVAHHLCRDFSQHTPGQGLWGGLDRGGDMTHRGGRGSYRTPKTRNTYPKPLNSYRVNGGT